MNKPIILISKICPILLILLVCSSSVHSQENFLEIPIGASISFTLQMDKDDSGVVFNTGNPTVPLDTLEINKIDESFQSNQIIKIYKRDHFLIGANPFWSNYINKRAYTGFNFQKQTEKEGQYVLCCYDIEFDSLSCIIDNTENIKRATPRIYGSRDKIITIRGTTSPFETSRIEIFDEGLQIIKTGIFPSPTDEIDLGANTDAMVNEANDIYISAVQDGFSLSTQSWPETPKSNIVKLNSNLEAVANIQIDKASVLDIILGEDGSIFAFGFYNHLRDSFDTSRDALLIKLDKDLNLINAILISAENFEYRSFDATINQDKILAFYSTRGRFPVITCTFDLNLNLTSEFGSDFENPSLFTGGSDFFYISSITAERDFFVGKVPSDKNLSNCKSAESCIIIEELDLTVRTHEVSFPIVENLKYDPVELESSIEHYTPKIGECFNEDPPTPDFNFIDTLCIGDCALTSDTNNEFAQYREWFWQSPEKDSTIVDSLNVSLCFNEAGTHLLSQTIWVLGCDYTFEQEIFVLDEIQAEFEKDVLCDEEPIARLLTNRDNLEIQWSDGEEGIEREILESGFYEVTLSDGFCSKILTADLSFLSNNINTDLLLQLPKDTIICQQDLPLEFSIPIISDEDYYLQDNIVDPSNIQLASPGSYLFRAEINGCFYEKEYDLKVDPCLSNIYLPTAFSPNSDGINDEYIPLGQHFEIINFQVYDRWGEILHSENNSWDGTFKNKKMQNGIYFYTLEYLNTLSGELEFKKGSFTLVR